MASPIGTALRPTLRRTTTLIILGALTILLAVPSVAFASPVSVIESVHAPGHLSATAAATAIGHHVTANPAASAALKARLAPLLSSPGRSLVTSGRTPLYLTPLAHASDSARSVAPSAAVHDAITSLAAGAGPAAGVSLSCSSSSAATAHCASALPTAPHPDSASYGWQNATPGAGTIEYPGNLAAGTMTYDAFDRAVIYFGGCTVSACPDSQTWAYLNGFWQNVTSYYGYSGSPPAVTDASMDYDYQAGAVVLFGGYSSTVGLDNETWIFSGGYWANVSAPFCFSGGCYFAPPPRYAASMTFANDSADDYTMLFGGCLDFYCYGEDNATWAWISYADAWVQLNPSSAPSPRAYASIAYDSIWGASILFGGCETFCGLDDTWSYFNGGWTNYSYSNSYYGFGTPEGRGAAQMTYFSIFGDLVLFGGTGSAYTNDTWIFTCNYSYGCGWLNVTPTVNLPGAIDLGATPSESSQFDPMVTGGYCSCSTGALFETYVFEPGFAGAPTVLPNPARTNTSIAFTANVTGGTAPYYGGWTYGYAYSYYYGYSLDATYAYPAAGAYTATLYAYDAYGVEFTWSTQVIVGNVTAQIMVSYASTDVGAADGFSTNPGSGGTAPYSYNWSYGDGAFGADSATVTHGYAALGTYTANLTVTDANALTNTSSLVVTVGPAPTATVAASAATVDLGTALTFTPTVSGGIGAYTYHWTIGGTNPTVMSPTFTYTAAGTFTASLTVTDSVGGSATASVSVVVNPAVSGTVTATPTTVNTGSSVSFSATGTGGSGTYTYAWAYGDGAKGATATGTHAYATAGTYTATVWINDTLGGSYSHSVAITVQSPSGGSGSSTSAGLPGWALWAVIGIVIVAVAAIALVMMGRRRKPSAASDAAPPTGAAGGSSTPPPPPGAQ